MNHDWKELTELTEGRALSIEKVRIKQSGISIEGDFDLPPLAQLTIEDQIFVTAFVRCQGSIKDMEELFGISYPTVKSRLVKISEKLEFVEINPPASKNEVLKALEKGEISVDEAIKKIGGRR
ncbi:MAG: DUF2089 domain-containing protein [Actinobacteria bacterium]|nr:DUF2089 domain-containing protein [Actinomycetota bacterium]